MIRRLALLAAVALVLASAELDSGCAKRAPAPVTGSPAPPAATEQATVSPGAPASVAPAASGAAESSPAGAMAPSPTPTGPVNLLSFKEGAIARQWPPTDTETANSHLMNVLGDNEWRAKPGTPGPFVFVFELAAPAQIDSMGFVVSDASNGAQSVRVEGSTQRADSGYTKIGDYTLKAAPDEQDFPLSPPATARWLRVTIQQRADFTTIQSLLAFGKLQTSQPKSVAGAWLVDQNLNNDDDMLLKRGFPMPDPALVKQQYLMMQIVQQNGVLRAAECHPNGLSWVGTTYAGTQSGAYVTWEGLGGSSSVGDHAIVNAEGNLMVSPPWSVLMRLPAGLACTKAEPPTGSGRNVLVLSTDGRASFYYPASHADQFPGFRFTGLAFALLTRDALAAADTAVMYCVDHADARIAPWQAQALIDFVNAGHKLIIYDADKCGYETDYSFLPYQFKTANPGANGASSKHLILVESDTLGSRDKSDKEHFWDPRAFLANPLQQIGDANTVTTNDPRWCGHLYGTNVMGVNGFMQMYAALGRGLIVYDGFDQDNAGEPQLLRLTMLELRQPVPALLPCSVTVANKFFIAPSQEAPLVPGRAATLKFPLQVLANQGYAGTVSLAPKAPAQAPWKMALSTTQVTLKGDTAPVDLTIEVPATNVAPGGLQFEVNGNDGQGNTAFALITLVAQAPQKVVKVKPVTKGCTEKLTLGADALFAFGEATLTPTAQKTLALLGPTISKAGKHPVQIYGYTDSIGSEAYNQALSEQRAKSVRNWLAAHGYVKASTPIKGFGKQHPVAPNTNPDGSDNPQGRAKNRRVEVLIDTCK